MEEQFVREVDFNKYYYKEKELTTLHREDGPAIEYAIGDKRWYLNDKCHRIDGPAVEYANGDKEWWIHGLLHRIDGPAVEYTDGDKHWYVNDKALTEEQVNNLIRERRRKHGRTIR